MSILSRQMSQAAEEVPTLCRVCQQPMSAALQPALRPERPSTRLVTCETQDCPLQHFTFSFWDYLTLDLRPYFLKGR